MKLLILIACVLLTHITHAQDAWIRINQLGYASSGIKVAVYGAKNNESLEVFEVVDAASSVVVFNGKVGRNFGAYGPFQTTYRLDFSAVKKPGTYYLRTGGTRSPDFDIATEAYKGAADFALRYMRQQRCGYNPFLKTHVIRTMDTPCMVRCLMIRMLM